MHIDKLKLVERYDTPKTIYLKGKDGGWIHKYSCVGKTKRSWAVGESWWAERYTFANYQEATEADYNDHVWQHKHRYKISRAVERCDDAKILREIARLVGYEEKKG